MSLCAEAMFVGGGVALLSSAGSSQTGVRVWEEENEIQRGIE